MGLMSILLKEKTRCVAPGSLVLICQKTLALALSGGLRLLLALDTRLLVMLSLTNLCKNTRSCAGTLKTTQRTVKGLVFLNSDF